MRQGQSSEHLNRGRARRVARRQWWYVRDWQKAAVCPVLNRRTHAWHGGRHARVLSVATRSCRPSPRMSPWFQPSATISHAPPNPGENSLFLFLACRMMHGRLFVVEQLSSSAVGRRLKSVIRTEANASTFAPCQMKLKACLEVGEWMCLIWLESLAIQF
jgi:hypothetical protein